MMFDKKIKKQVNIKSKKSIFVKENPGNITQNNNGSQFNNWQKIGIISGLIIMAIALLTFVYK